MKSDPFTRTPGVAGSAFINMHYADKIIESLNDELSSKFVYKIVGLRGSGKSVEYSKIIEYFSKQKNWLTYTASAAGSPTKTVLAKMSQEKFIKTGKKSKTYNMSSSISGNLGLVSGSTMFSLNKSSKDNDFLDSEETMLYDFVSKANKEGYKVLIGIDDIARSEETIKFLSILGSLLLEKKKIYFVCTGLSKNIEDFTSEANLTFFRRSDSIAVSSLDYFEVASMYTKLLHIDNTKAAALAKFVKGYAYAYQVLGSLYFNKKPYEELEDLLPEFDKILFQDSYDLIWKTLSKSEKELVKIILNSDNGKVSDIKEKMNNPHNFAVLRDRLMKKHLVNTEEWGILKINLPRFKEYIELWES